MAIFKKEKHDCGCHHHGDDHHEESCACGHHHGHDRQEETCGCGHHHEHDHQEETCTCGHHHGHDHQEETCGCGHHHEHDHQEETCGCGHHHEHDHQEETCSCGHHHEHDHQEETCSCAHHHEHDHQEDGCSCRHHHEHRHSQNAVRKIYILENLGCAHCAAKMEEQIRRIPGVEDASITYATRQLRITAADPDRYLDRIRDICTSIESQVVVIPQHREVQTPTKPAADRRELAEICLGAALFLLGIFLHNTAVYSPLAIGAFVIGYLILGGRVLAEAGRNLCKGHVFDENFLMSLATLGAFAIREYPEAMGVMLFYRIGEYFEHKAVERSRGQIMDAIDMRPEVVNLLKNGTVRQIPADQAQPGDLLLIRPGDRIPLDGIITDGTSRIDTSPITGEPVPLSAKPGDHITSGCVNQSSQLIMRAEKPLSESMVSRILDSVENAAASKPKIDRFITRFAKVYTPIVILLALATAIVPSLVTGNWNYWVYTALSFLVMSCPCALVLSVPLAFFSGIGIGSRKGILFKGGLSIEAMSKLKAVVMDKTGTLTQGNFRVQKIQSLGSLSEESLLQICASCEQNSTHPIAESIVAEAAGRNLTLFPPQQLEEIPGHGIAARTKWGDVLCGNRKLMEKYRVDVTGLQGSALGAEVFLAIDGQAVGNLLISDTLKEDAAVAVHRLEKMGLHTAMLTGDEESGAAAVAEAVGIREVHARLLPQDKLTVLKKIRQAHGCVMFVGDGINDAPVLAGADVGAAMGSGADAAIEAADAVFMTTGADSIPEAIAIARSTNRTAIQNVVFALSVKILVMVLGLFGYANMWMAVFADSGVAMLCVINSIRILYKK